MTKATGTESQRESLRIDSSASDAGRIHWIEWMRALGCCAIVLLHVLVSTAIKIDMPDIREVAYLVFSCVFCRWAVPAFFMVTGFLLLNPDRDLPASKLRRYAWRMACVLLTFGLAFACMEEAWTALSAGSPVTPALFGRALWDVITTRTWDHLWYVYALMGTYVAIPALRWLRREKGERMFASVVLVLFVIVLVIPTVIAGGTLLATGTTWDPVSGNLALAYVRNLAVGITCVGIGGCLNRLVLDGRMIATGVASLVAMVLLGSVSIRLAGYDDGSFCLHWSFLPVLYAVMLLMLFRRLLVDMEPGKVVLGLSQDSFGIYVIHPLYIHIALMIVNPDALPPKLIIVYDDILRVNCLAVSVLVRSCLQSTFHSDLSALIHVPANRFCSFAKGCDSDEVSTFLNPVYRYGELGHRSITWCVL